MDHLNVISVLFLLCSRARLFIDALWSYVLGDGALIS